MVQTGIHGFGFTPEHAMRLLLLLSFCVTVWAQTAVEPVRTSITVVGESPVESPGNITVEDGLALRKAPGVNLDDRLRLIPGFSLFRRSSSLVAHPTTQGVSLRGIGPTGASRTLVQWDGVPVNDPFGGWVQWTRFPPDELDRVEVSRGASTSVFGDRAMGGALSLFSRPIERNLFHGSYEFGNRNTHQATGGFARIWRRIATSAAVRGFTTNGYYIVPEAVRGAVDREANVRFFSGVARLDWLGSVNRFYVKVDALAEERSNGTPARRNSTSLGTVSGHFSRETVKDGISLLGYHTREEFRNVFSAVAADRNTERPTTRQSVPAEAYGAAGTWRHSGSRWNSTVGGDAHYVEGYSNDTSLFTGKTKPSGGTLLQHGYFGQFDFELRPVRLFAGSRYNFADQGRRFFSPSAGATAGFGIVRLRGSVYRSFRNPTLNELYRQFRVGNVITRPNAELQPERMWGAEGGVDIAGERARLSLTAFRNSLADVITNVTTGSTPSLILRQRRNAARALARGFEAEARYGWRSLLAQASYLFVESRFAAGERVPQVPKHQGSAQLTWSGGGTLASGGLRAYAAQFEDDLNRYVLPGFAVLHLSFEQRLAHSLYATAEFENLLNREFLVGLAGSPTIGNPRLWRAGLRWDPGRR